MHNDAHHLIRCKVIVQIIHTPTLYPLNALVRDTYGDISVAKKIRNGVNMSIHPLITVDVAQYLAQIGL
jgi:hypothetical protein